MLNRGDQFAVKRPSRGHDHVVGSWLEGGTGALYWAGIWPEMVDSFAKPSGKAALTIIHTADLDSPYVKSPLRRES